jgi:non-ribosomal peptide synthetase component F
VDLSAVRDGPADRRCDTQARRGANGRLGQVIHPPLGRGTLISAVPVDNEIPVIDGVISIGDNTLLGLMQQHPLLISSLIEHAERAHPDAPIVSCVPDAPAHRCTYADIDCRARQLAMALTALGIQEGDRVGTLAWNGHRHVELFFGASGMGAVLHTVNPQLFPEQIEYIINHAEDQHLFLT